MRIQEIEMPPEVMAKIFDHLPQDDRCNARLSCTEFRDVLQLPQFYRSKSFTIIGQDEKEEQRISRYLRLYRSYLKHMSISVEAYKKPYNTKALRRRITSELLELFNTEQLWSLKCQDLYGLYRFKYYKSQPSDELESIIYALARMLQRQERLSEVIFIDALLDEEEGCALLQALATSTSASRLTTLTFRHFFSNDVHVDFCPVFLELMGRLQNLVNVELVYRCMSATVLAALINTSTSLKNVLLYMEDCKNTLPSTLPDWKLVTKKRPELQVWMNMIIYSIHDWNYQEYLLPEIPMVGFSVDRVRYCEDGSNIELERDITDITGCLIQHRVKSLILKVKLQMDDGSEGPRTCRPEALVALVKACPWLSLLCLQMTVTIDTLLRLAAAANPQSREGEEEEEGVHTATPDAPRLQIHVSQDIVLTKSVLERLSRTNPFCIVLNCSGCEPVVNKAGFI